MIREVPREIEGMTGLGVEVRILSNSHILHVADLLMFLPAFYGYRSVQHNCRFLEQLSSFLWGQIVWPIYMFSVLKSFHGFRLSRLQPDLKTIRDKEQTCESSCMMYETQCYVTSIKLDYKNIIQYAPLLLFFSLRYTIDDAASCCQRRKVKNEATKKWLLHSCASQHNNKTTK